MKDFIKTYNEGKDTGTSTMTISDDGVIVLFKKEYELDSSTYPPTVKEKVDTVQKSFTQEEIDARIVELQEEIELLQEFKENDVDLKWKELEIDKKIKVKKVIEDSPTENIKNLDIQPDTLDFDPKIKDTPIIIE